MKKRTITVVTGIGPVVTAEMGRLFPERRRFFPGLPACNGEGLRTGACKAHGGSCSNPVCGD